MAKTRRLIQIWLPGMTATGGIQAFSRDLLAALGHGVDDVRKVVMVKSDPPAASDSDGITRHCFGRWPGALQTAAFTLGLIVSAVFYRPSLIVVGHANFARVAAWIKRLLGIPYWVIVYGIEAWDENGKRVAAGLSSADRILAISNFTRDKVVEQLGLDPSRFMLLPTTFDDARFSPEPKSAALLGRLGLRPNQPIILTVCRLAAQERYKGYDQVISALPKVLRAFPAAHYVIVGRGPDEARIREMVARLGLERHVTLAGFVGEEELAGYYNLCEVFAMPSKKEGFGIVFLEALACGKPVIAGNKDGSVDAVCRGELGALVDPDDVDEIAESLVGILQGSYPAPALYRPDELRRRVIDAYGFERFTGTLAGYLKEFFHTPEAQRPDGFRDSRGLRPAESRPDNR
jgi:glycosyltransferase involved in cell wall biosynthesis